MPVGRLLIVVGLVLVGIGLYLSYGGKTDWLGKLPGDFRLEKENFSIYFPLGTCLLISALISLLLWLMRK